MYNDIDSPHSALDGRHGGQTSDPSVPAAPPRFGRLAMCVAAASALAVGVMGTVAYGVWFNHDQREYAEAMAGARQALAAAPSAGADGATQAVNAPAWPAAQQPSPSPDAGSANAANPAVQDPEAGGQLASWSGEITRRHSVSNESAARTADSTLANAPADVATNTFTNPPADIAANTSANMLADMAANTATNTPANMTANTAANTPTNMPATMPVNARASAAAPARRQSGSANPSVQQVTSSRSAAKDNRAAQDRRTPAGNARHKDDLFTRVGLFFRRVSYRQHDNTNRQDLYSHP